jgi:hypothetical protein
VIWELSGSGEQRQRRAMRILGVAFLMLATYLGVQAAIVLVVAHHSRHSPLGVVWTALTAVLMFSLAANKG